MRCLMDDVVFGSKFKSSKVQKGEKVRR